jgi:hypothetical protein
MKEFDIDIETVCAIIAFAYILSGLAWGIFIGWLIWG